MKKKGFSLVELMVVIVLIGVILGMSIPIVKSITNKMDVATRSVVGAIRVARETAISRADTIHVVFNNPSGHYEVYKWTGGVSGSSTAIGYKGDIPKGITLSSDVYLEMFFLPSGALTTSLGAANCDSVIVENTKNSLIIKVIPATGIARIIN